MLMSHLRLLSGRSPRSLKGSAQNTRLILPTNLLLCQLSLLEFCVTGKNTLIMGVHLVSGSLDGELPVDFDLLVISLFDNRQDFSLQLLPRRDAPVQTRADDGRELDLDHIEPTAGLRRVVEVKALGQCEGFIGWQGLVEGTRVMRVQVVLHEPNLFSLGPSRRQRLTKDRVLFLGTLRMYLGQPCPGQRFNRCQQGTGPVLLVGVMLL